MVLQGSRFLTVAVLLTLGACHGRAGTHPEAASVEEEAQYDPNLIVFDESGCTEFCYRANPTGHHLLGLQRLVDCHLTRNAAMGFEMEEMAYCPLGVAGVHAKVVEIEGGLDIQLDSKDAAARAEVRARVEKLLR